jgi:hypothetical protein
MAYKELQESKSGEEGKHDLDHYGEKGMQQIRQFLQSYFELPDGDPDDTKEVAELVKLTANLRHDATFECLNQKRHQTNQYHGICPDATLIFQLPLSDWQIRVEK